MEKPSGAAHGGHSQECSSHGINLELVLFWGETTKFSESGMGLGGAAVCWGGIFPLLFLNNVYNLPQSLF